MLKDSADRSILTTICFYDIFDTAVDKNTVHEYLYAQELPLDDVASRLSRLVEEKHISSTCGYYTLPGREYIYEATKKSSELKKSQYSKIKKAARVLQCIPYIKSVFICNSYSIGGYGNDSDIDLFIITNKNYIWLTRILSFLVFQSLGIRRFGDNIENQFCLSFFIADGEYDLHSIALKSEDPYLAFWTASLIPLWDSEVNNKFFQYNLWLYKWLPSLRQKDPIYKKPLYTTVIQSFFEQILSYTLLAFAANKVLSVLAKDRNQKRIKDLPKNHGVIMNNRMQKLHDIDYRDQYRESLIERILKIKDSHSH